MAKQAFTLIELLIVVAIIAVLAAIAIPNFLEAQTRAKVSRVCNDLRTLANAIRQYEVDYNGQAMPCVWFVPSLGPDYDWIWTRYRLVRGNGTKVQDGAGRFLTSPVAYISSIPYDIFNPFTSASNPGAAVEDMSYNWFYCGRGKNLIISEMSCFNNNSPDRYARTFGRRPYRWSMFSPGPDRVWWPTNNGIIYDPTNGTLSGGDIWFFDAVGFIGGTK